MKSGRYCCLVDPRAERVQPCSRLAFFLSMDFKKEGKKKIL